MTREEVHESIITDNGNMWFKVTYDTDRTFNCHADYEILFFIQGDAEFHVEGCSYILTPESIFLIPPGNLHSIIHRPPNLCKRASIHFFPEILDTEEQHLLMEPFLLPNLFFTDLHDIQINSIIDIIRNCKNMEAPLQKIVFKHQLISLLACIRELYIQTNNKYPHIKKRIDSVLQYINENVKENISLEKISEEFYINQDYLNKIFQKEIGITIHRYIQIKRLILARQEIRKGSGIEEAAYNAGFNDYSNFFRAYKSFFGIKPSAQRNEDVNL